MFYGTHVPPAEASRQNVGQTDGRTDRRTATPTDGWRNSEPSVSASLRRRRNHPSPFTLNTYNKPPLKRPPEIKTSSLLRPHVQLPVFWFYSVLQLYSETTAVLRPSFAGPKSGVIIEVLKYLVAFGQWPRFSSHMVFPKITCWKSLFSG